LNVTRSERGDTVRNVTVFRLEQKRPATNAPEPDVSTQAGKPKLLDQVRQAIRTRHYSYMTEKAYVGWIKWFIFFHNKRHPAEMAEAEIAQFLSSLANDCHVSASTQNQALNALLFLYHEVLGKEIGYISPVLFGRRDQADYQSC
jgi:integrase-like protein